jgi:hypothetical protein
LEQIDHISGGSGGSFFEIRDDLLDRRESFFLFERRETRDGEKVKEEARGQIPIVIETTDRFEKSNIFLRNQSPFPHFKTEARIEIDMEGLSYSLPIRL